MPKFSIIWPDVYVVQGKGQQAEETLLRAIEADPKHAESYLDLAKLYEQRRDAAGARKLYQDLLKAIPAQQDALFELATLYDNQGDAKAARDTLRQLTKTNPKHANAWYLTGRIAEKSNALVEAAYRYGEAGVGDRRPRRRTPCRACRRDSVG